MENNNLKFNSEGVKLVEEVGTILKSRTQSIRVTVIEKDGERFISLQKWWRKSPEEDWQEGKGFHFNLEESTTISNDFVKALEKVV